MCLLREAFALIVRELPRCEPGGHNSGHVANQPLMQSAVSRKLRKSQRDKFTWPGYEAEPPLKALAWQRAYDGAEPTFLSDK